LEAVLGARLRPNSYVSDLINVVVARIVPSLVFRYLERENKPFPQNKMNKSFSLHLTSPLDFYSHAWLHWHLKAILRKAHPLFINRSQVFKLINQKKHESNLSNLIIQSRRHQLALDVNANKSHEIIMPVVVSTFVSEALRNAWLAAGKNLGNLQVYLPHYDLFLHARLPLNNFKNVDVGQILNASIRSLGSNDDLKVRILSESEMENWKK